MRNKLAATIYTIRAATAGTGGSLPDTEEQPRKGPTEGNVRYHLTRLYLIVRLGRDKARSLRFHGALITPPADARSQKESRLGDLCMMLRQSLLVQLISMFFGLIPLDVVAISTDLCEEKRPSIVQFVSSFPRFTPTNLLQGNFAVRAAENKFEISYSIGRKTVFQREFPKPAQHSEILRITPIKVVGRYSALYVTYLFGDGSVQCTYIVFPSLQTNQFRFIHVRNSIIKDIDSDGETEIVVLEYQEWANDCHFSNAQHPYFHRIFHLSPNTGKMIDVSDKFPQYYIELVSKFDKNYRNILSTYPISRKCQDESQKFLKKVEFFAGKVQGEKSGRESIEQSNIPVATIIQIKHCLRRLNYDPGPIDGTVGEKTQSAIRAYQKSVGMSVTGQISRALYDRLLQDAPGAGKGEAAVPLGPFPAELQQKCALIGFDPIKGWVCKLPAAQ